MKKVIIILIILILLLSPQLLLDNEIALDNNLDSINLAIDFLPQGVSDQINDFAETNNIDQNFILIGVAVLAVVFISILIFIILTAIKLIKVNKNLKVGKKKKKDLDKMIREKKSQEKKRKKELKAKAKLEEKNKIIKSVKQNIVIEKPVQTEKPVDKAQKAKNVSNDGEPDEENLTDDDIYIVNTEIKAIAEGKFENKADATAVFSKIENPDDEFLFEFDVEESTNNAQGKNDDLIFIEQTTADSNILDIDKSLNNEFNDINIDETLSKDSVDFDLTIDEALKSNEEAVMSEQSVQPDDNLIDFSNINHLGDITNENIILDKPKFEDTILDRGVKEKITDIPSDVKIIDDKQDNQEEVFNPNSKIFGDKKIYITKKTTVLPKCFESYLQQSDESVKWVYNELKNELLSYKEVHSRIITGCEIFRKSGIQAKILIKGKTLYVYLRISSEGIDPTYVKVKDMSNKKAYAETPTEIRVSGKKKVNRCKELIAAMFEAQGIEKSKEAEYIDYAKDYPTIPNAVIYSRNLVYKN